MSAAAALALEDYDVTLLEKRATLGGRAGSYYEASTGEYVDNCQHVLMPCCTNLLNFYSKIGVDKKIRFHSCITFIDRKSRVSTLRTNSLPAPFHCAPSFLALKFLSAGDKIRIVRGLMGMLRFRWMQSSPEETALDWFLSNGQSIKAIEDF